MPTRTESHLRIVRPHESPPHSPKTPQDPFASLRRMIRRSLYVLAAVGTMAIGGEITGFNCISTPYRAYSVLDARSRLTDIREELMAYESYIRSLDTEKFLENPWAVRKRAIEVAHILDEAIEIIEDIKESGTRFRPAVLMEAFGFVNIVLDHLESDQANELYRKAEKWRRKKSRGVFVDKQGVAAAGYAIKNIRNKVRAFKRLLTELQDSTLNEPTNNSLLNIVMDINEAVIETTYASSATRLKEQLSDLQYNNRGEYVAEIQRRLIKLNLLAEDDDDGICLGRTMNAVRIAREIIELIEELKFDDRGRRVKKLQRYLIRAKCLPAGEADGVYKEKTAAGVLKYKQLLGE